MENDSVEFRKRVVQAYRSGQSGTYAETARIFVVCEATVSRLRRQFRETGDVVPKRKGGTRSRKVDLVSRTRSAFTKSSDAGQDVIGRRGPDEWLRILISHIEVLIDGALQIGDAAEGAAPDRFIGDLAE